SPTTWPGRSSPPSRAMRTAFAGPSGRTRSACPRVVPRSATSAGSRWATISPIRTTTSVSSSISTSACSRFAPHPAERRPRAGEVRSAKISPSGRRFAVGLLGQRREPLHEWDGPLRMRHEPVDEGARDEQLARRLGERHDEPLALEEIGARMVRIETPRHPLQHVVRADPEAGPRELPQDRHERSALTIVDDRLAKARELSGIHHVVAGGDEHLRGAEVYVQRRRGGGPPTRAVDRDVAADVRLVGRLVPGEADVAVDAEDLRLSERMVREKRVDALPDLGEERLHGRQPAVLVLPAVRLEPLAPLIAGEGTEEPSVAVGKAFESSRCWARRLGHVAAHTWNG